MGGEVAVVDAAPEWSWVATVVVLVMAFEKVWEDVELEFRGAGDVWRGFRGGR